MNDSANVGQRLRHAREARGLSLDEAAEASGVAAVSWLQSLERGDPAELAGQARLLAWLRVYARFLGLDAEALLRRVTAAVGAEGGVPGPWDAPLEVPAPDGRRHRWRRPAIVGVTAVLVLLAAAGVTAVVRGDAGAGVGLVDLLGEEPSLLLSPSPDPAPASEPAPAAGSTPGSEPSGRGPATPRAPAVSTFGSEPSPPPSAASPSASSEATGAGDGLPGRAPSDTRVQLLDGTAGTLPVAAAERALAELGYDIVLVEALTGPVRGSYVYYTEGWETEARSLSRRDPRFSSVAPDPGLTADVDLHVVMGTDWAAARAGS